MGQGTGSPPTMNFLGLEFARLSPEAALDTVLAKAKQAEFTYVVTPNVAHVVELDRAKGEGDDSLARAYARAALRLCDSRILALLARRCGIELPVVAGSDLTASLLECPLLRGVRVAIIGSTADALGHLVQLRPDVDFVQFIPPMGVRTDPQAQARIVEFVERVEANIVLFALGFPQSELLACEIARRGKARGIGLCIGASIDFIVGTKRRAPRLLQRLHLEWAHRLASEPRRLWRRYLVEGPRIFAIWQRWRKTGQLERYD